MRAEPHSGMWYDVLDRGTVFWCLRQMMNSQKTPELRKQLEGLVIESPEFRALEKRLSNYCPFEAMGIVNAEIRHSNFLASMMDPFRPHGLGTRFLREVLDGIVAEQGAINGLSRLQLHVLDLDDADIRREWKRIDLLVVFHSARLVVAFELKIGASEGEGQLRKYRKEIDRQWPSDGETPWTHLLLFLTRNREDPSDEAWRPINYDVIIDAVDRVLEQQGSGEPMARAMLKAYASMLRKHHMDDPILAEQARILWQRHREALEYLMEQRPDGLAGLGPVLLERMDEVAQRASIPELHLERESSSTKSQLRFFVKEWEELPDFKSGSGCPSGRLLLIELQFWVIGGKQLVKALLVLGPGPAEIREKYFSLARPKIMRAADKLTGKWKTFASDELLWETDLEETGTDAAIEKLIDRLRRFVERRVVEFDKLFATLKLDRKTPE